ncbi:TPA: LPXTG cell wall anchor domain-containing protein [Streptococcus equi subsp. zooepidemicus]|nr:LPXTG cell wall anchor domain-containing protein [Streptococcus equi subsp. zooepidemicus]
MKQMETKGYGYFRKTKAHGLVCGIALAGALTLSTTTFADEATTLNPATNLTTLQTPPTANQTELANQAGHQSGELVSDVSNAELDNAVTKAQETGVAVKQSDKVTHDSLSSAQADLAKQMETVKEATTKQEANKVAINQAMAENKAIDQANRDEKARVEAINTKGEADTKAKNEAGQAQVDAQNKQAQAAADAMNARLKAEYEAKLTEIERIKAENEAIRQRNQQASQATNQANQAAQAAYQEKLAEIERIKAENEAIRQRNQQAQAAADAMNARLKSEYEAKLEEIKQIEADNEAIRQSNQAAQAGSDSTNEQRQKEYEAKLAAYNQAVQAKAEAEKKLLNQVDFSIEAKANGVDNTKYGNSIMTVTTQSDGSFVFKHDMIDGQKTIGYGKLTGKVNHHYVANKDGSITAVIDSVTFNTYEYENVAKNSAVNKNIVFRIVSINGDEIYSKPHDGETTFKESLNKTITVNKEFTLQPHTSTPNIQLFQLHDDWIYNTHGSALVAYKNNNDAVPNIVIPSKPVPPTPGKVTPTPEKPVPPTPVKPEEVKPALEPEKQVPATPEKPIDSVPNVEKEKPVPPTPVKPETVKPDLKSFTPEIYNPIKPVVKPHVTVPEKVVYEVMVHPVQVKQTPTNVKSVTNSDQVNIDGQLVPKGSTVTWELVNAALKAGRQDITSYELTDPLPDGFELDVTATQTLSPDWVITTDEAGKVSLKASQTLLDDLNAKRDQDVEVPKVSLVGRLLNDAGTYHNTFKTVVTTPTGSYTVTSNTPVIYTPGNDPKTPRNPGGDNPTPHDNLIQPTKTIVDDKGQSIDGKSVLPNSTLTYVAKQDFDQYKGMTAAKESVMKGFIYVDDYKDEAIDGHSLVVNSIKAANGDDVTNLLEMRHVLSQDTLDDKLKALIKASGISPVGEFYMWVAKDPAAFYKAYVQKGLDITYNLSFKLKQEFKKGDITNQTYQLDMGNGYYGNVVVNHLPELAVHKDVLDKEGGQSINASIVKVGDEVTYRLEGWVVPTNRSYDLFEYKFVDQLQQTHDLYLKDSVVAKVDITLSDGTVIAKGSNLAQYTETVYNKETGQYELAFKQDFLAKVVRSSEFGADAFVVVKRIKAGDVYNTADFFVNGNKVKTETVVTHTPENPRPVTPQKATPKAPALPSTGEQGGSVLTVLGAALLSLLGLVGLKKRQQ